MTNYFEVGVQYEKVHENGLQKKVTEQYLIDAVSFTEAEKRSIEEMRPFISGEFAIVSIKRAKLSEIFFNANGDRYFRAKVLFITLDEKSGTEKKTATYMLVQASNIQEAKDNLTNGMKGTMADYEIAKIEETKIMDVFKYEANNN